MALLGDVDLAVSSGGLCLRLSSAGAGQGAGRQRRLVVEAHRQQALIPVFACIQGGRVHQTMSAAAEWAEQHPPRYGAADSCQYAAHRPGTEEDQVVFAGSTEEHQSLENRSA
jgi:hypothetical protein